jgi:hypothetical protein
MTDAGLRLLLLLTFAFNLFWGAGSMVFHAITNQDDWAIAVANLDSPRLWRIALVGLGSSLYVVGMRRVMRTVSAFAAADPASAARRARRLVLVPYLAAGVVAPLAAGFYLPDPGRAIREGALEVTASLGLLAPALWNITPMADVPPLPSVRRSTGWIGTVIFSVIVFTTLLGHGIRQGTPNTSRHWPEAESRRSNISWRAPRCRSSVRPREDHSPSAPARILLAAVAVAEVRRG